MEAPELPNLLPSPQRSRTRSAKLTRGTLYIQPKIMDEEFPDYQKLCDHMATDPTPVTLHDLPSLAATPTDSGLKRSRTLPTEGEGEFEDT